MKAPNPHQRATSAWPAVAIALAALATLLPEAAALTFSVNGAWPDEGRRNAAVAAATSAINRYNAYGNFNNIQGHVDIYYNAGIPTAQASFGGDIGFGGTYPNERVMMHEMAHFLGLPSGSWNTLISGGWSGPRGAAIVQQFDGVGAKINGDGAHFWPYGLNYDSEGSEINKQRQVAMVYAMRADMGIGPSAHPSTATTVTLTASDPFGTSGFNYKDRWSDGYFAHAGADYSTGGFLMRTPESTSSFNFAGKSLTLSDPADNTGLLFKGLGANGLVTIDQLNLHGGWITHGGSQGLADLFRLDGALNVSGSGNIRANNGNINILADVHGSGALNIHPTTSPATNDRYVRMLSSDNTFTGSIVNQARFELGAGANYNFVVGASGVSNAITGASARNTLLNGKFQLDLSAATAGPGDSWALVTAANTSYGATFNIAGFEGVGGVWSNGDYTFSQATGLLTTVTQWAVDGPGVWSDASNWTAGTPLVGADAKLGTVLTAPATVDFDDSATLNRLTFEGLHKYTVSGGGTLSLTGAAELTVKSGGHQVDVPIVGSNGLAKRGAGALTLSAANPYSGDTSVEEGTLRLASAASINNSANVRVRPGATLDVSDLSAGPSGGLLLASGQNLEVAAEGQVLGGVTTSAGSNISGAGAISGVVTVVAGSALQVGGASLPVRSAPRLIDNFDSYNNSVLKNIGSHPNGDVTGGVWDGVFNGTGAATVEDDATPQSPLDNALQAQGVNSFGSADWRGAVTDLANNFGQDFTVQDNATTTVFFQFKAISGSGNYDTMFGLTDGTANLDNNSSFQDFAVMPFLSGGGIGAADFKATTAGGDITAISNIAGDTWYNVWLVVDTAANLFDVYTSTGHADGVLGVNDAVFRNGLGTDDLAAFGFSQRLGGRVQIDNLHMLPGVNTGNPLAVGGGVLYAPETLTIAGDALLQPGASATINIASSGVNDLLSVGGLLTLAGTLEVVHDASAPPLAAGDSFDLLDFQSIAGAFDVLDLPDLGANLRWDVAALTVSGTIRVAVGLAGDFNNDGVVDAADYSVWRDHLGAFEDAAILSGNGVEDGIVDAGDYELWRSNFGAVQASASTSSVQTPEPASVVLLVLALGIGAGMARGDRRQSRTKSSMR